MKFELLTLKASLTTQKLFLTFPLKSRTFAVVLVTSGQKSEVRSYYSLFTIRCSLFTIHCSLFTIHLLCGKQKYFTKVPFRG